MRTGDKKLKNNDFSPPSRQALHLAKRMGRVGTSPTAAVSERVRAFQRDGIEITNLGEGELDFATPDHVADAAKQAIDRHETKYTAVAGTAALKEAIRTKFRRDNELDFSADEIIAASGAKQIIFNAFLATLDAGDQVIIAAPYWVSYPDMIRLTGADPVVVSTTADQGWKLTPDALAKAITPHTRWVVLNSPGNPTGAIYTAAELAALLEVISPHPQILVLADDIYEPLRYGMPFATPLQIRPDLRDRILTVNGVSKSHAMTGWRLGYGAGPRWLIAALDILQSQSTSNPSSISQAAAVAALNAPPIFLQSWLETLAARRDIVLDMIAGIPSCSARRPDGAFYVFMAVSKWLATTGQTLGLKTDVDMASWLIETARVATVPGSAFGTPGHLRIAYAVETQVLRDSCERIKAACTPR
ncbi:aspartate aminotransferase [Tanticharoenia sakaeratensis NBRC 103193]|nr:aspartate aminotransferase [Tanticharoenia sakaeratensis NBRC 103193]